MPPTCSSLIMVMPRRKLLFSTNIKLTARPMMTPISKSVNTMASTVIANGINCARPPLAICTNNFGLASLNPVATRMAASAASGIWLSSEGSKNTHTISNTPWVMQESRVRAPALALTELRTITDVMGMPPINPAATLPTPCAKSSRLGGETRFCGSSLSVASKFKSVSSDATIASVRAAV